MDPEGLTCPQQFNFGCDPPTWMPRCHRTSAGAAEACLSAALHPEWWWEAGLEGDEDLVGLVNKLCKKQKRGQAPGTTCGIGQIFFERFTPKLLLHF